MMYFLMSPGQKNDLEGTDSENEAVESVVSKENIHWRTKNMDENNNISVIFNVYETEN